MASGQPNLYLEFHRPRFAFMIDLLRREADRSWARLLDIGRSPLTHMIWEALRIQVDSLGLEPDEQLSTGRHFHFDLNRTDDPERALVGLGPYDAVVFAEVIEHLYAAPERVLTFVRGLLKPGGLLVLQTPNAAALGKRVKLAFGRNPYQRIRLETSNPGHYREYTKDELIEILRFARLSPERTWRKYYFDARFARHETGRERPAWVGGTLRNVAYRMLPPSLREGITVVARRDPLAD